MYKIFDHSILDKINKKTAYYLYDKALLKDTLISSEDAANTYLKHSFSIHYALKANDNKEILRIIKKHGFGVDAVSGGEIKKALKANFNNNKIVFAGVGKTDKEIKFALKNSIYAFNTESIQEIEIINNLAKNIGVTAKIMMRINPDVDAKTHKHISTGKYDNKFGITFDDALNYLDTLKKLKNISLIGLHYHIGSQITDMAVFKELAKKINQHYQKLASLGIPLTDLNIGGGLGINYQKPEIEPIADFVNYFKTIATYLDVPKNLKLHFELGRSLVAQCGVLISQVLFTKNTAGTNFAIIDAGMNDLMRPALYSARHKIVKLASRPGLKDTKTPHNKSVLKKLKYNIVGPVCESTDVFIKNLSMPELARHDKVIIYSTGAYGKVLANAYNSRSSIKEYLI